MDSGHSSIRPSILPVQALILAVSIAYIDPTVLFGYPSIYILGNACTLIYS